MGEMKDQEDFGGYLQGYFLKNRVLSLETDSSSKTIKIFPLLGHIFVNLDVQQFISWKITKVAHVIR